MKRSEDVNYRLYQTRSALTTTTVARRRHTQRISIARRAVTMPNCPTNVHPARPIRIMLSRRNSYNNPRITVKILDISPINTSTSSSTPLTNRHVH